MLRWPGGTETTGPGICATFCPGPFLGVTPAVSASVLVFYYRFAIQRNSKIENLGGLAMANDTEAIEFGKLVVQDLIRRHSDR